MFEDCERHETPVRTVAFSHDGNFLASASEDDFIDICDPVSSKRVCEPIFVRTDERFGMASEDSRVGIRRR